MRRGDRIEGELIKRSRVDIEEGEEDRGSRAERGL